MLMTETTSWHLPPELTTAGEKYFKTMDLQDAERLLKLSRVNVSFSKGSPETYFICSGIIKDDRKHESKIVYKKRLEDTSEGPLKSNCDCHKWTPEDHCPHVCALFLSFHIHLMHEKNFDGTSSSVSHPPIALNTTFAVNVMEYGTIIGGPHQLQGAPTNPTYSSLQYLLHNKKISNFPIPEKFEGKLVLNVTSSEYFNESTGDVENLPLIRFKYRNKKDEVVTEISLFENLYLFNWLNGEAFHLTSDLKSLIQKIRIYGNALKINDLIKVVSNLNLDDFCEIVIDGTDLKNIPTQSTQCQIHMSKGNKKSQVEMKIIFLDGEENLVMPPDFLSAFTFNEGYLSTFRKKKDAYDFIAAFYESLELENDAYKKILSASTNKNKWQNLISYTRSNQEIILYEGRTKRLLKFENEFLLNLVSSMYKSFSELFFRFSEYNRETREVTFQLSGATLFQGLSEFYNTMIKYGVSILYDRNEISRWSSKIRFERRTTSTKWFDLELGITDSDLDIIENADMENGLAVTKQGLVLLTPDQKQLLKFIKKYTDYESDAKVHEEAKADEEEGMNRFILPFNRARIFELFELKKLGVDGALTKEENELCERLATLEQVPEYEIPDNFKDVLRPYQKTGYHWLKFLYENGLGACLADDMGLGKTVQAIAFLQSIYNQVDNVLIVCPVTILLNWEKEFAKFSDISVQIYHGGDRNFSSKKKITLTSYGVMKREIDTTFKNVDFDILILDEVQHLKNIRSLGAYAARKLNAKFRITLTGTPVENDLAEFYNIMDLSIPGIWGDLSFIRTTSTKKTRTLARKTASPFILRRTKAAVLQELPPKIENNVYLNFTDDEKANYTNSLVSIKKKIEVAPSKKKYGEILRGLLELRQSCLWQPHHKKTNLNYGEIESTKIEFLVETLEQIIEEGHQAIVFSQFTTYLDIIQYHLRDKHWKLARIDGSQTIKRRQQQVDLFQEGKCPIFLISLKAGGVGLNLTAASYVFVMDPWWNPAVELQAIDRAHRIGQKNTLTVYRPIIKDSVEEKVLELQKMKRELFYDLLPEDDDSLFTGKLSMKDFEDLFN